MLLTNLGRGVYRFYSRPVANGFVGDAGLFMVKGPGNAVNIATSILRDPTFRIYVPVRVFLNQVVLGPLYGAFKKGLTNTSWSKVVASMGYSSQQIGRFLSAQGRAVLVFAPRTPAGITLPKDFDVNDLQIVLTAKREGSPSSRLTPICPPR